MLQEIQAYPFLMLLSVLGPELAFWKRKKSIAEEAKKYTVRE